MKVKTWFSTDLICLPFFLFIFCGPIHAQPPADFKKAISDLINASKTGFNDLKGDYKGKIDGTPCWKTSFKFPEAIGTTIWGISDDKDPPYSRISIKLFDGSDEKEATRFYIALKEKLKDSVPSSWTESEKTHPGRDLRKTSFDIQESDSGTDVYVNWLTFLKSGRSEIRLDVQAPDGI